MKLQSVGHVLKDKAIDTALLLPWMAWRLFWLGFALFTIFMTGVLLAVNEPEMVHQVVTLRQMTLRDLLTIMMPLGGVYLGAHLMAALPELLTELAVLVINRIHKPAA